MRTAYRTAASVLAPTRLLGRGGEGQVFALADDSRHALKIYLSPDAEREAKVESMVAAGLARRCPGVAFPEAPAYAYDGSFVGFVMPFVEEGHPIHELYSPKARRRVYPNADWRFLVRTAINTARVMDRVHAAGAVVGDINGSGVLVSKLAVVSLIDADSFQWGAEHPCRVGVPEFTPPELQGRSLSGVVRTIEHDAFGLAVLIFQLLFLGRHPHAGVPKGRELALTDAIAQNCFAYSHIQSVRLAPPRGTLLLADLPSALATLFERAFAGHGRRPLPREWIAELESLEAGIVPCVRKEGHCLPLAGRGCPWCRIERATCTPAFGSGAHVPFRRPASIPLGQTGAEVARVLARAKVQAGEGARPPVDRHLPSPSVMAASAAARFGIRPGRGPGGRVILAADSMIGKGFASAHHRARRVMDGAVDDWRNRIGAWTVARSAAELAAQALENGTAGFSHESALARVTDRLRDRQIALELGRLQLTAGAVPGLGNRSVAKLAEAGITSAADLSRAALEAVHGMGERGIVSLLLWHADAAVAFGRTVTLDPIAIGIACEDLRRRSSEEEKRRERRLGRLSIELDAALDELAVRTKLPDRRVEAAVGAYRQTLADLRHLGMSENGA